MDTPDDNEDREWEQLAAAEFLKGYAESDAIYDEYHSHSRVDSPGPSAEQGRSDHERP